MSQRHWMKEGFTLVELAIVLVIIGLIIGGVLVGRDMIASAKNRSALKQIEEYKTAFRVFQDKYGCLPGDCRNASNFFGAATQPDRVTNGNGDGLVQASAAAGGQLNMWVYAEMYYVFDHLAAAKMVDFSQYDETAVGTTLTEVGYSYPESKFEAMGNAQISSTTVSRDNDRPGIMIGNQEAVGYIRGGNVIHIGMCKFRNWGGSYVGSECGLNPWEAYYVDSKMDDGIPTTGSVLTLGSPVYLVPNNGMSTVSMCAPGTVINTTTGLVTSGGTTYYSERTLPNHPSYWRTCRVQVSLN